MTGKATGLTGQIAANLCKKSQSETHKDTESIMS
jgi:hypothetical protein